MPDTPWTEEERVGLQRDIVASNSSNVEAFDKAILTLSSAALTFSVVFAEKLVRSDHAVALWALKWSWCLFAASIASSILGYLMAMSFSRRNKRFVDDSAVEGKFSKAELETRIARGDTCVHYVTVTTGVAFLVATSFLTAYMVLNTSEVSMKNGPANTASITVAPLTKAATSGTIFNKPVQPQAQPAQSAQPAAQPSTSPANAGQAPAGQSAASE